MLVDEFIDAVKRLTGTEAKEVQEVDRQCLSFILADDDRPIDWSQFNELLLLVNKDRVERPFFDHFFGGECTAGHIAEAVEKFQKEAMLRYGNFIYAFRTLAHITSHRDFRREYQVSAPTDFSDRAERLIDITPISRDDTPLVGYITPSEIVKDKELCAFLTDLSSSGHYDGDWDGFQGAIKEQAKPEELQSITTVLENYRATQGNDLEAFTSFLQASLEDLNELERRLSTVRETARRNQDVYLTWDHMDVYFATSMRKAWEYQDLFDFISAIMKRDELRELDLRYFDPTQCYMENRIDKGLVESLMLKRAKCTVYSVQDTDTLGKDSELAATLAQGKTVIAYVPEINPAKRAEELERADPLTIWERMRFVIYADEKLSREVSDEDHELLKNFQDLDDYVQGRVWLSIQDVETIDKFRGSCGSSLGRLCRIIADSEKRIYDKRANTLVNTHPLAIQINLETGVANGVLVVRTVRNCASLLKMVLDDSMQFQLEEMPDMWYLREQISGCVYRVVTKNRKLTNCFWNFYLKRASNKMEER